ncbi:hypothetical protein SAMN04489712_111208 [Thermomonospora echinospora]|uniref:Uncharacterized protein n=1 Tax=Thermomonospora echinospora TaxID=1992 RepID=A0A1H6CUV1_9ACTN|nr:hypothetical protein SAMN04489712_111208 [Thermomonospora echinospora]
MGDKHAGKPQETKPFEPKDKPSPDGSKGGGGKREK